MNNWKPAIIAGVSGFGLSLLITLANGVRLPDMLIRPLLFGGIFFAFAIGSVYLYRRFLSVMPEDARGQNVDISVDDDTRMIINADEPDMNFTGFEDANMPQGNESRDPENGGGGRDFTQNKQGLEQNSTLGYTDGGDGLTNSFKHMDFNILSQNTGQASSQSVAPLPDRGQKIYAKVPGMEKIANADPKKLASTVQDLLSDE
jgi:hypothetical protein